jgi:hypothetical protein
MKMHWRFAVTSPWFLVPAFAALASLLMGSYPAAAGIGFMAAILLHKEASDGP